MVGGVYREAVSQRFDAGKAPFPYQLKNGRLPFVKHGFCPSLAPGSLSYEQYGVVASFLLRIYKFTRTENAQAFLVSTRSDKHARLPGPGEGRP